MKLKMLHKERDQLKWPKSSNDLPVVNWDEFQKLHKSSGRNLIVIGGFVHDVTDFIEDHPGGWGVIKHRLGKDATTAFVRPLAL
jgi:stearoyl-CoA desaturase (delta-9 desaturase)